MKYQILPTFSLGLFLSLTALGQNTDSKPSPTPPMDDVVKITTKLVQVDAVVTDKDGKTVTDLKPGDFEIFQDGKAQQITNLSYVNSAAKTIAQISVGPSKNKTEAILPPPVPLKSAEQGRLVTFIVDDGNCNASSAGMIAAREGLKKFVNEQMQPGDRVAIYHTLTGSSVLQQYMTDKTLLLRSIEKIRWYPPAGSCVSNNGAFFAQAQSNILDKISPTGMSSSKLESDDDRKARESYEDSNRNNQVNGTIGVLDYVVKGLERVGGRKVVFFMSDGLQIRSRSNQILSAADTLRNVSERANRAGIVFDTIDVRGVFSTSMIEGGDEVRTQSDVNASDSVIANRDLDVRLSQDGMYYLANATGGRYYQNSNKLDVPVKKALDQELGYYLIAYEPSDDTFRGKNFNKIEVKVKRPELRVRAREGFFGYVDQPVKVVNKTADSELYQAMAAPLPQAGINVGLTAFFGNSAEEGNFVRALFHLPGDEITFVDDAGGMKKAVLDVAAVTLDEKNQVVDEFTRTHTFKVKPEAIAFIKQHGLTYSTDVPIKKPGVYTFRVGVRDAASRTIGTSSQTVEIPDLKKGRLFLSGLTVSPTDANGKFSIPGRVKPENALAISPSESVPSVRQFRRGSIIAYSYVVYNAQLDKTTGEPSLTVQTNLYRNGQLVSEGKPEITKLEKQPDWTRVIDFSYLRLNAEVEPGDYTLQVIVRDSLSPDKAAVSSQWIDFELVQ